MMMFVTFIFEFNEVEVTFMMKSQFHQLSICCGGTYPWFRHGRSRATMARTDSLYQRIFVSWLNLDGGRENTRSLVL